MKNNATRTIRSEEITIDVRICAALAVNRGGEIYLAAIAPDMELTVITLDEAPDILPCFEEDDACLNLPDTSLLLCYNPAQVLKMGGKHYLTGPVILVRTNMDGEVISLTIDEVYLFQKYLESHSIRPIDIENFLKGMRRDGRSDSYISKARGMLYQIFQKAEANDLVRRNPVRLAEKMRATGTAKRKEAFTTAEVAHLMKVLPDDRMGLSIRLLLGTGMRMQELLALEPQFIEEDGSVIHIRQAVKVVKGTVSIGSPKSKDSIRDIPVPLNVRPCAIKLRDTTDQFIWESPKTGLPCNPTHFRDVFRKSLEEAGDVRLLTPHSCRHTYVSQMQALGVDIQTIQSIVGHADTEMTEHYLHVQESIRQSAIQLFSETFSA